MTDKTRVAILFGGKSAEHEVSLQSATNIIRAIDRNKYDLILIGIDKQGRWLLTDESRFLKNAGNPKQLSLSAAGESVAIVAGNDGSHELISRSERRALGRVDVVFPALHGPFGEDGTIQGLLKLMDVPFVGAGVLGSAAGMDKDVMKRLLRDAGLPIGDFLVFAKHELESIDFDRVAERLGVPMFVKPANLGSSVGIHKVSSKSEFDSAVRDAFSYDLKVIIEQGLRAREIECSVLGNETPVASLPGEIIPKHDFYSYDAKYVDADGATLVIPADLPDATVKEAQRLAVAAFRVLCCEGMARMDFFLTDDGNLYINEINTIPGFTGISMYPKLWEVSGIPQRELIDRLIQLALDRHKRESELKTSL